MSHLRSSRSIQVQMKFFSNHQSLLIEKEQAEKPPFSYRIQIVRSKNNPTHSNYLGFYCDENNRDIEGIQIATGDELVFNRPFLEKGMIMRADSNTIDIKYEIPIVFEPGNYFAIVRFGTDHAHSIYTDIRPFNIPEINRIEGDISENDYTFLITLLSIGIFILVIFIVIIKKRKTGKNDLTEDKIREFVATNKELIGQNKIGRVIENIQNYAEEYDDEDVSKSIVLVAKRHTETKMKKLSGYNPELVGVEMSQIANDLVDILIATKKMVKNGRKSK